MKRFKLCRIVSVALAALVLANLVSAAPLGVATLPCVYDGYVAMGGMVVNTTNAYLLPGNPNSAPVPGAGPGGSDMQTFGYAFLKFDIASLAGPVPAAYLNLGVIALQDGMSWPASGEAELGVFAVSADVASITAGTAGSFRDSIAGEATSLLSVTGIDAGSIVSLDVTDIVNAWIASGDNFGLVLATPGGLMPRLHSSASFDGPAPSIAVVPEPLTLSLLAIGLAVTGLRKKRNR